MTITDQIKALETKVKFLETNIEVLRIIVGKYAVDNNIKIETLKSGIIVVSEKISEKIK